MRLRLALVWATYMFNLGTFFPYFSLFLGEQARLAPSRVGLVVGVLPLVGVFVQPLWGQVADRTGTRRGTLAAAIAGTAALELVLGRLHGFAGLLAGTLALALFWTAVLPLLNAATLAALGDDAERRFGSVRLWGTLGFLAAVVAFPRLLERYGETGLVGYHGLSAIFPVAAAACAVAATATLTLPRLPELGLRARRGEARRLLAHPPVRRLLLLTFCGHLMMQGPIQLFPLFLAARGGDAATVGWMWVAMLALEVPLIAGSGRVVKAIGARGLIAGGLAAESLRWGVTVVAPGLGWIRGAQLLHGAGVAGVFVGGPLYVERAAPASLRSTGQSLVSMAGFGAGTILSVTASGWLMEHVAPDAPYVVASIGAALLALAVFRVLPPPTRPATVPPTASEILPDGGGP